MSIKYGTNKIANNRLNTRVELWRLDKTEDAYGAETSVKSFVKEVFAQVVPVNNYRQMKYNELGFGDTYDITFRWIAEQFDFLIINNTPYTINSVKNRADLSEWIDITAYADNANQIGRS